MQFAVSITTDISLQKDFIRAHLEQPLIIIGLMGAGKTSIGKMLAEHLGYDFVDSDDKIVERAGRSIPEIFGPNNIHEQEFRDLERQVIADLMADVKPHVIGTGGGAFMNDHTRKLIKDKGLSVFLKASLDVLCDRVGAGEGRPLLMQGDPRQILSDLIEKRYPVYGEADLTVETLNEPVEETLNRAVQTLYTHLKHS